ncbi:MAG: hypothetical protein HC881_13625, partial [Leptolyngbyaceae cyanobacterium SL_7_1]|nr:hypothetical protein [Leptolyngbyaceae cyanobacterium SL_7_1]
GRVSSLTAGVGNAGNIAIDAGSIEIRGIDLLDSSASNISSQANPNSTGNGGDVTITSDRLLAQGGGFVSVATFGSGAAGDLLIFSRESIDLIGGNPLTNTDSGLFATVEAGATGAGGNLTAATGRLTVLNGATVSASTFGEGDAGILTLRSDTIELAGTGFDGNSSNIAVQSNPGATGDAGNLTIDANGIGARDGGFISSSTFGSGNAGDSTIRARVIDLSGVNPFNSNLPTGLFAQVNDNSGGRGGDLVVTSDRLSVRDGAFVSVQTLGAGEWGQPRPSMPPISSKSGVAQGKISAGSPLARMAPRPRENRAISPLPRGIW